MKTILLFILMSTCSFASAANLEATFNEPTFRSRNKSSGTTTVEDKLISLIHMAAPGSAIHIAMYDWDRIPMAQAVLDAVANKVGVSIVMDGKAKKELKNPNSALSMIKSVSKYCSGSCNGANINHNKFFLFTQLTDGRRNVIAQTSANMTEGQLGNYNDLVVIDGDNKLYNGFMAYWKDLYADDGKLTVDNVIPADGPMKAYVFPRMFGSDPVLKALNQVNCSLPNSVIRLAQSRFDNSRSDIAARLAELVKQGCDVKVIARNEPSQDSPGTKVAKYLGQNLIVVPYEEKTGQTNSIHSKMILIDASMENSKVKMPVVMTGSHNLNVTSLKFNDEILLKIVDRQLFESYLQAWDRMRASNDSYRRP